ncbi:hypothetical protein EC973_005816 [Apophysomyces ossiformis]|uniref:MACPF domain-containing protein n=1 Tax=Apophysomyces ossiformis TaxID=679940 RepID=A0A8H7BWK1_9FUNG|nr:hypothetical protein EC973_005816 [Apophysomyces ossiformis]
MRWTTKLAAEIPAEWLHSTQIDGTKAKKQAVEIALIDSVFIYPEGNIELFRFSGVSGESFAGRRSDDMGYVARKLPVSGTAGFQAAAMKAAQTLNSSSVGKKDVREIHVPRRYVFFPPTSLRATKSFEQAVRQALEIPIYSSKFAELQYVFRNFGYYYPYWIETGGKFIYKTDDITDQMTTARSEIETVIERKLPWTALGGDLSLLNERNNIEGWLESTANRQCHVTSFDMKPTYDLLEHNMKEEVKRTYELAYTEIRFSETIQSLSCPVSTRALVNVSKGHKQIGIFKGVQFDGSMSEEDAVALINEHDIKKAMIMVSAKEKPVITGVVRRTLLGTKVSTQALLHSPYPESTVEGNGFMRGAISNYVERNGGELQPATRGTDFFVLYAIHRELILGQDAITVTRPFHDAVRKAIKQGTDKEKYKALQQVFGRFGYYYPSVISLGKSSSDNFYLIPKPVIIGGRVICEPDSSNSPTANSIQEHVETVDRAIKQGKYVETLGGSCEVIGCQDWIDSVATNQERVLFKSMKPMYELLDQKLRSEILDIYNKHQDELDEFITLPRGIHIDGQEAQEQAIQYTGLDSFAKLLMLKVYSQQAQVECLTLSLPDQGRRRTHASLDIEDIEDLPGSYGFLLGAEAAMKEKALYDVKVYSHRKTPYHLAYITLKEVSLLYIFAGVTEKNVQLHLHHEYIQPSAQFSLAVQQALNFGTNDSEKYFALQDVFQRFGYYYPSITRMGGRVICEIESDDSKEQSIWDSTIKTGGKQEEKEEIPREVTETAEFGETNALAKWSESLTEVNSLLYTKENVAIQKAVDKSSHWQAIGGDSQLLLWQDVENWVETLESNPVVIQRRSLKPLYELLDVDTRQKVQDIYEQVVVNEQNLIYNYPVTIKDCKSLMDHQGDAFLSNIHVTTEELFALLLRKHFEGRDPATDYCRDVCASFGFPIVEEDYTDKMICISCSYNAEGSKALNESSKKTRIDQPCSWSILLMQNDERQWVFRNFPDPERAEHNHSLTLSENKKAEETDDSSSDTSDETEDALSVVIKFCRNQPLENAGEVHPRYIRYGDIVLLQYIRHSQEGPNTESRTHYIGASNLMSTDGIYLPAVEDEDVQQDATVDIQWKIVPCAESNENKRLCTDYQLRTGEETNELFMSKQSDGKYLSQSTDADLSPHSGLKQLDGITYVQRGDVIAFESLRTLDGQKLYLCASADRRGAFALRRACDWSQITDGWQTEPINEHRDTTLLEASSDDNAANQSIVESTRQRADEENLAASQYRMGYYYMYGFYGLSVDKQKALKYLEKAASQSYPIAFYLLAKLLWSIGNYPKAYDLFRKAVHSSALEACRELGDIYHTGFSSYNEDFIVPQDYSSAFMHYSTGGIFGDPKAAFMAGEYFESGYCEEFGVDNEAALRWYEYVNSIHESVAAKLAIGRLKHILADAEKDLLKAEDLREQAYASFQSVAASQPYARYMLGIYHINGWGHQELNPTLGFELLLTTAESGLYMPLKEISRCYAQGIGVKKDALKAETYQQLAEQIEQHSTSQ